MAILIAEPANENPGPSDWMQNLLKMTMTTGSLLLSGVTKTDTPAIIKGSRFEVNGSFYYVNKDDTDETVHNWSTIDDAGFCYIYAVPDGDTCTFSAMDLSNAPMWIPALGGWFMGTSRALYLAYKSSLGICTGALVMDRENYLVPGDFIPDAAGGKIKAYETPSLKNTYTITLSRGWYYAELISGAGNGDGGNAHGGGVNQTGGSGGIAATRTTVNVPFYIDTFKNLVITVGGDGFNGGYGGWGNMGGGGGGGSGGGDETTIQGDGLIKRTSGYTSPGLGGYGGYVWQLGGNPRSGGYGGGVSSAASAGSRVGSDPDHGAGGAAGTTGNGGNGGIGTDEGGGGGGGGGAFGSVRSAGGPGGKCIIWKLTP
jgi:hypothetical protein